MGKKLNQASLKISKNEKQEFNSLIKVLRPKVYITDSSSFKKLVQELTGNNTNSTTSSPTPLEPKKMVENCTLIEAEVQRNQHSETSAEISVSTEATSSSSHESYYDALVDNEFNQVCNQICLEDIFLEDSVPSQNLDHLWEYQNVESLLFDDEINPFFNCYAEIEPEVSIYDYELSGLL